ncbi:MAG: hypothetical protein ACYC8T_38795 [Myxococcaceae bacterium]
MLCAATSLLRRPDNDFAWSSWGDADEAASEIESLMKRIEKGDIPRETLEVIFAATGPMQEVSLSSGWAGEFLELAARFDSAMGALSRDQA